MTIPVLTMNSCSLSLFGGVLIGIASSLFLLFNGKILGVSGIIGGLFRGTKGDSLWRLSFVIGLVTGGSLLQLIYFDPYANLLQPSYFRVAVAGCLVGIGTQMGKGCTSGHGVCGCARLSPRSMVATGLFIISGALTVFIWNHLSGAAR